VRRFVQASGWAAVGRAVLLSSEFATRAARLLRLRARSAAPGNLLAKRRTRGAARHDHREQFNAWAGGWLPAVRAASSPSPVERSKLEEPGLQAMVADKAVPRRRVREVTDHRAAAACAPSSAGRTRMCCTRCHRLRAHYADRPTDMSARLRARGRPRRLGSADLPHPAGRALSDGSTRRVLYGAGAVGAGLWPFVSSAGGHPNWLLLGSASSRPALHSVMYGPQAASSPSSSPLGCATPDPRRLHPGRADRRAVAR